jgi:hypothetical protein
MSGINESSRKNGDVIGIVHDIAAQADILVPNAAVEAARGRTGPGLLRGDVCDVRTRATQCSGCRRNAGVDRNECRAR